MGTGTVQPASFAYQNTVHRSEYGAPGRAPETTRDFGDEVAKTGMPVFRDPQRLIEHGCEVELPGFRYFAPVVQRMCGHGLVSLNRWFER
jgi:hypothetical protein